MKETFDLKNIDTDSCISGKEDESLLGKEVKALEKKLFRHLYNQKEKHRSVQVSEAKNFPTYFFLCFLIILTVLLFKFVPDFYGMTNKHYKLTSLIKIKYSLKYFSEFLRDLDIFSKLAVIVSQIFLLAIVFLLSTVFKRNSKNEILKGKASYFTVNIFCFLSVLSFFGLAFFPEKFMIISNEIKLVDNILFPVYMFFTYFLAAVLYLEISKISKIEEQNINNKVTDFKIYFIGLMGLQVSLYCISVILVSYITATSEMEKFLEFILILCINANSFMFMMTFTFYVLLLKNDLVFVFLNLKYSNPNEFFIDIDEDTKNVL